MNSEHKAGTPFQRALNAVSDFSEPHVAVLPEKPSVEMLDYIASLTNEDADKLARLYQLFLAYGRLDKFQPEITTGLAGFAEE